MKKSSKTRKRKETTEDAIAYRTEKLVTQYRVFKRYADPVCPTCNITLDRCYQMYCCSCGQCLKWGNKKSVEFIYLNGMDEV